MRTGTRSGKFKIMDWTSVIAWYCMTRTPMTTFMIAWYCMTRTPMTTFMIAWYCTMRTPIQWKFQHYQSTSVIHTSSNSWKNDEPFSGMTRRKNGPPNFWDTHGISGNVFVNPDASLVNSTLSSRIESMEFIDRGAASFIHSGEKWKAKTRSEMPVWTVSQKFSHLQWSRFFKELWRRPTTIEDFGSSLRQVPYTSNLCLLEDKVQDWNVTYS